MKLPTLKRREEILKLPSTWSDVDFASYLPNEKLYWFQYRRVEPWLLNDTRQIKEKAGSMFGLIAMVCIGVEFLSKFRYGNGNSNVIFPTFLEEYLNKDFSRTVANTYNPNPPPTRQENWFYSKPNLKYSEIFYFGMRNHLMHRFQLTHSVLIEPRPRFLSWERKKRRLLVDARMLLVDFENGVLKYLSDVWKSNPGDTIYNNFYNLFTENYQRTY
jgi:hypothetical protein